MDQIENTRRTATILVLLTALTLAAFWPLVHCEFTNYDDPYYVTANPHVLGGLTVENVFWAFRTGYYGNWFPLTWLSHMADVELFGLNPVGHHLTSLLFHMANTCLLFWVLRLMTGAAWRSAVVAALFAVHPLRVESVAWIAERKDVLSTFFFMLTLWAYVRYAQKAGVSSPWSVVSSKRPTDHASRFFLLSLLFFACGLMSKAMIVTLPCILLLLDFWPLGRFSSPQSTVHSPQSGAQASRFTFHVSRQRLLLFCEKLLFLALAAVSTAITFCTQREAGGMGMVAQLSFGQRVASALVSYVNYIGKIAWPSDLAVLYPHHVLPIWEPLAAAALLLGLSIGALKLATNRPYVPVGWFWFLGTLLPAIGLIQVGEQAMADRFTYVPSVGLSVMLVWWASELAPQWRRGTLALGSLAAVVVALLGFGTVGQLRYWRNSKILLEREIAVTGGTAVIHNNLGAILADEDNWPEAERHFAEALRLDPTYSRARISLALGLARQHKTDEAVRQLQDLQPAWRAEGHRALAETFLELGETRDAILQYLAAIKADPTNAAVREKLGMTLAKAGRTAEASDQFAEVVRLRPDAEAHYHLALSLVFLGQPQPAVEHFREAVRLKGDWPEPLNDLAWLLATCSKPELRNGAEAVGLAERACQLSGHKEARFLGTLDAAYAEAGRFGEAKTVAEEARKLALGAVDQELADAAAARLALYQSGRAYHQP